MTDTLGAWHGVDDAWINATLRSFQLENADHRRAEVVRERAIRPQLHVLVSETRRRFGVASAHLLRVQLQALDSLGRDFDTAGYFEARLRAIAAHDAAGVPLPVLLAMHTTWAQAIVAWLPDDPERAELTSFVLRITGVDQALAAHAYEVEHVGELKRELARSRASERRLRYLARTDSLTGLVNRPSIDAHLDRAVTEARDKDRPLSIVVVDVDRFKDVNDEHGHATGDAALRCVSQRMKSALRDGDWLGRYGGEEFLVVLRDTDGVGAGEIAERLRGRVAGEPIEAHGATLPLTISLGVAQLEPGETAPELVARADGALYEAKRRGRDRVTVRDTRRALDRVG